MSSEDKQNGFPGKHGAGDEQDLNFTRAEWEEFQHLKPAPALWEAPETLPADVLERMPGEEAVKVIFEEYFGSHPPEAWTVELARAMVNLGRKRIYRWWKQGKLRD